MKRERKEKKLRENKIKRFLLKRERKKSKLKEKKKICRIGETNEGIRTEEKKKERE